MTNTHSFKYRHTLLIALFAIMFFPCLAQASLMIKPTRLVLDDRTRSGEITLLNNSTTTKVYRILWEEKQQITDGSYSKIEKATASDFIASPMLRHSPRKVTIKPGQYQKVKVRFKMPRTLADGEYRSHLLMKVIEDNPVIPESTTNANGPNVIIIPRLSFSIPILVRKGSNDSSNSITSVKVDIDKKGVKSLSVDVEHTGSYSSYGSVTAYMKVGSGKVSQIGETRNVALFRGLNLRNVSIPLQTQDIPKGAVIQVLYRGEQEYEGKVLAKAAFKYE